MAKHHFHFKRKKKRFLSESESIDRDHAQEGLPRYPPKKREILSESESITIIKEISLMIVIQFLTPNS